MFHDREKEEKQKKKTHNPRVRIRKLVSNDSQSIVLVINQNLLSFVCLDCDKTRRLCRQLSTGRPSSRISLATHLRSGFLTLAANVYRAHGIPSTEDSLIKKIPSGIRALMEIDHVRWRCAQKLVLVSTFLVVYAKKETTSNDQTTAKRTDGWGAAHRRNVTQLATNLCAFSSGGRREQLKSQKFCTKFWKDQRETKENKKHQAEKTHKTHKHIFVPASPDWTHLVR